MVAVAHQDVGMKHPSRSPDCLHQRGKEHLAILIVSEDPLLPVAPAHHVVGGSWKLDANLTRHA